MHYQDFTITQESTHHESLEPLYLTLKATIENVLPKYNAPDRLRRMQVEIFDLISLHNKKYPAYPLHSGTGSNHIWINEAYAERVRERVIFITFKKVSDVPGCN